MKDIDLRQQDTVHVRLTMTRRQAELLVRVLGHVSGNASGPRGETERMYHALVDAGIYAARVSVAGSLTLLVNE